MALTAEKARLAADGFDENEYKNAWYRRAAAVIRGFAWKLRVAAKVAYIERLIRSSSKCGYYSVCFERPDYWRPFEKDIVKTLEARGYAVETFHTKHLDLDHAGASTLRYVKFYISWRDS